MQTATILQMNQEESTERDEREERHTGTQRDIKSIKLQVDKLSGAVGELVVALKGNEFGTEGMVVRVQQIEQQQNLLNKRLDELELAAKKKEMYIVAFFTACGVVIGTIIKSIIDHAFKK